MEIIVHNIPADSRNRSNAVELKGRPSSAPPRLENSAHAFRVVDPSATHRSPTPTIEDELSQAKQAYQAALSKEQTERTQRPVWTTLFGVSKETKEKVAQTKKTLTLLYSEKKDLEEAIEQSKQSFQEWVRAQGGNPAIAEAVFHATALIPDPTTPSSHVAIAALQDPAISDEDNVNSVWTDVDSETSDDVNAAVASTPEKSAPPATPLSLENFFTRVDSLSEKEIHDFIDSLSKPNCVALAQSYFDASVHDIILRMSPPELKNFLMNESLAKHAEAKKQIPLTSPEAQQTIAAAFLDEPAPLEHRGLSNSGVDCYLSSALQTLKVIFINLPQNEQELILNHLREDYATPNHLSPSQLENPLCALGSPLIAFLENKFDGRNIYSASFLRQEIQNITSKLALSGRDSSQAARTISENIDPVTGHSREQHDTSEALGVLMEYVGIPPTFIQSELTFRDRTDIPSRRKNITESVLPIPILGKSEVYSQSEDLALHHSRPLQDIVNFNYLTEHLTGDEKVNLNPDNDRAERLDAQQTMTLTDPPNSITISIKRFAYDRAERSSKRLPTPITDLTAPLTLPTNNHRLTQYNTSSIICHYGGDSVASGHYATFVNNEGTWHLINDGQVTPIPNLNARMYPDSERTTFTYEEFLQKNAYVVNYRKAEEAGR
ncbi:MAG: hypothetical protein FJ390_02700 [Verrucomicrobia bacterium]|nr:hypothetical protein [Verrucomicrobiota bacterium]